MTINAQGMHFQTLNDAVHAAEGSSIKIENCIGQRYIGSGLSKKKLLIQGTPGNALGPIWMERKSWCGETPRMPPAIP